MISMKKPHEDPNCRCEGCTNPPGLLLGLSLGSLEMARPKDRGFFFSFGDKPFLEFRENGQVFVRGERVDDNQKIYAAVAAFFQRAGALCPTCNELRETPPPLEAKS